MKKLLIVEDNEKLRNEIATFFRNNQFEVACIERFEDVKMQILKKQADLILLDINLPGVDGLYLCREIRKVSEVPIIIITSRNTEIDELSSMNYGADDFVTKPFNTQILLARMNNIFKRLERSSGTRIDAGQFIIDASRSSFIYGDEEIELTRNEFKILYLLVERRGSIVSRDEIMNGLWDSELFIDDNSLTVNINRLRNKLKEAGLENIIETKRGQGYIIK
nr:response regulator transcription factor [uncultured Cellulosilyticum sp.]